MPARCVAILAATLLVCACSGGGGSRAGGATSVAPSAPTTTTAVATPTDPTEAGSTDPLVPGAALAAPVGSLALYDPPSTLTGVPGDLVWARERSAPAGARAWTVLYLSEDHAGRLEAVSGVVVAPMATAPAGGRPVVAWAHGTVGSADGCAPSRQDEFGIPSLERLLAAGYVVAATDYAGLGTPGPHPFLDGTSEGRSVLDSARAAQQLTDAGAGPDVLIWGHSQGGHAALFAAQLAPVHAPELRVLGVVAAAPVIRVSDLAGLASRTPYLGAFYLMVAAGLLDAHPELDEARLLSPAGSELLPLVDQDCLLALVAAVVVGNEPVGASEPLATTPWAGPVAADDLGPSPLPVPVLVTQGGSDPLVLPTTTQAAVLARCALGDRIRERAYPAADHATVLDASAADTLAFFAERLRGDTPTSGC